MSRKYSGVTEVHKYYKFRSLYIIKITGTDSRKRDNHGQAITCQVAGDK